MIPSRLASVRGLLALLLGALALLGVLAPQASAATKFLRVGELSLAGPFGGTGDGSLNHQQKIAIEHSTNNVLRTDVIADEIDVYSTDGTGFHQIATFGSGDLSDPHGIAVDQSNGDVYVANAGGNEILRYTSDGQPVPSYTLDGTYGSPAQGSGTGEIGSFAAAIALDPVSGDLLVADPGNERVMRFDDTGAYDGLTFDGTGSPAVFAGLQDVAVDSTGDIVVVDSDGGDPAFGAASRVERFDSAGAWEATIGPVDGAANVAIRPATDEVVVSGNQDAVNTNDFPTLLTFDSPTNGRASFFTGGGGVQYSTVSGLAIDNGPFGQLFVGTDVGRPYDGGYGMVSIQEFEVLVPTGPAIESDTTVTDVIDTSATLNASVNPRHTEATYYFEYGTTTSYGSQTTPTSAGEGNDPYPVTEYLSSLQPGTTYHVRIVVDNGVGAPVTGDDVTFSTAPEVPPVVEPPAATATAVGTDTATLHATVNPGYAPTSYHFEYGKTTAYGSQTTPQPIGDGIANVPVTEVLSGLDPSSTYHFRIVADNGVGAPVVGADRTFVTDDLPPAVTIGAVTGVGLRTASFQGTVDTLGVAATARFYVTQVGGPHSQTTPVVQLGATEGPQALSATLEDLPPGATFRVRLSSATDASGAAASSAPVEFSTAPLPPYIPTPPVTVNPKPYGCEAPKLNAYDGKAKPGQQIALTGSDLGVHGTVAVGDGQAEVVEYGASKITIVVPADAAGTQSVTVNCGKATNTIALAIAKSASTRVGAKVGSNGALTLSVPGAGRLTVSGAGVRTVVKRPGGKSTTKVKLKLTKAGRKQLANSKSGKLTRRVKISFRPKGGSASSVTRTVTFKKG